MSKLNEFLELFKDENIARELSEKTSPEEVKDFLDTKGLDYSLEEIKQIGSCLSSMAEKKENGELSEDEIAEAAGGIIIGIDPSFYNNDPEKRIEPITDDELKLAWDVAVKWLKFW